METSLDFSRWREKPNGIAYRRWVIVSNGLRQVLRTRFFQVLLIGGWAAGLFIAGSVFCFSQSLASGGWLESGATGLGPRAVAVAKALGALVLMYPDVCIRTLYTSIFWLQSFVGLWISLVALTVMVPQLIARDRASNAMTIYLSRPLTSTDYLLGKLGIIVGVISLFWTGPLIGGWLVSLMLSPSRDFLRYSLPPLGHALFFNLIGLVAIASIALGVSALNKSSRNTIILWIGLWIIAATVAGLPHTPAWVQRASFSRDLGEIRQQTFRMDRALLEAVDTLPLIDHSLTRNLTKASEEVAPHDTAGAAGGLAVLVLLSSVVFLKKLRPE